MIINTLIRLLINVIICKLKTLDCFDGIDFQYHNFYTKKGQLFKTLHVTNRPKRPCNTRLTQQTMNISDPIGLTSGKGSLSEQNLIRQDLSSIDCILPTNEYRCPLVKV